MDTRTLDELLGLARIRARLAHMPLDFEALIEMSRQQMQAHGSTEALLFKVAALPAPKVKGLVLNAATPLSDCEVDGVELALRALGPWKKGPFQIGDCTIDSEWRSDLKWDRVISQIGDLKDQHVLDVGTGNGYFLLRALGSGATSALGLEPSIQFLAQFLAVSRYFPDLPMALVPLVGEVFPRCASFDTVMSMGVLYHRRSPIDHLTDLRSFLRPGGRLVVETIVVDGPLGHSLVPQGRYAMMRNVWFLPSPKTLESWLKKLGFVDIELGPLCPTTHKEQRSTSWTGQPSLSDFLDPLDPNLTIEGHPAPTRIIVTCRRPD